VLNRHLRVVPAALAVVLAVSACASSATPVPTSAGGTGVAPTTAGGQGALATSGAAKQLTIAWVNVSGPDYPFSARVMKGAQDAANQVGVTLHYTWSSSADINSYSQAIQAAIASKPDGIAWILIDPVVEKQLAIQAEAAGIAVVAGDGPPDVKDADDPYLAYTGSSETLAGQRAAQRMLTAKKPKAAVCLIAEQGNQALERRCAGFTTTMQAAGVSVDKLPVSFTDLSAAQATIQAYVTSHPDCGAMLGTTPQSAIPAIPVVKASPSIMLGGFDLDDRMNSALQDGTMMFTVEQQIYLRGYLPVMLLANYLRYRLMPASDVLTGPSFVDKSNINQLIPLITQGYH
jgi:simple sugar transport system substrate-binding protein